MQPRVAGPGPLEAITVMFWTDHDVGGWGYALMSLSMLVFWGLVITGIVLLVRNLGRSPQPGRATPEQILAERFARGEIDEDEYQRRLQSLGAGGTAPPRS